MDAAVVLQFKSREFFIIFWRVSIVAARLTDGRGRHLPFKVVTMPQKLTRPKFRYC